jgi:hypothetical protein
MRMRLVFSLLALTPLTFAQVNPNSITVSTARNASLQPDQAVFSITVEAGVRTGFDDVLASLQGVGITAANFSGVNTSFSVCPAQNCATPPPLDWTFSLPVPLTKTKDTVATLTTLQQNLAKANDGLSLSFRLAGTRVSQQLAQSQTCSIPGLIVDATTQAQGLAAAGGLTLGSILSISTAIPIEAGMLSVPNPTLAIGAFLPLVPPVSSAVPPPCAITVTFNATRF